MRTVIWDGLITPPFKYSKCCCWKENRDKFTFIFQLYTGMMKIMGVIVNLVKKYDLILHISWKCGAFETFRREDTAYLWKTSILSYPKFLYQKY